MGSGAWRGEGSDSRVRIFLEELLAQGRPCYLSSIHVSWACLLVPLSLRFVHQQRPAQRGRSVAPSAASSSPSQLHGPARTQEPHTATCTSGGGENRQKRNTTRNRCQEHYGWGPVGGEPGPAAASGCCRSQRGRRDFQDRSQECTAKPQAPCLGAAGLQTKREGGGGGMGSGLGGSRVCRTGSGWGVKSWPEGGSVGGRK